MREGFKFYKTKFVKKRNNKNMQILITLKNH